jgi:hypothetical protein
LVDAMFAAGDHLIDNLLHFVNLRLVPRSASCDRFAAQTLCVFGQPDAFGAGECTLQLLQLRFLALEDIVVVDGALLA